LAVFLAPIFRFGFLFLGIFVSVRLKFDVQSTRLWG
jgi:hypothetical protein